MNAYETKITPTVAKMKASGTARPTSCAGSVPLSAIAAVGAMIAIERAIASQKCSSRRSPPELSGSRAGACVVIAVLPVDGLVGPKLSVLQDGGDRLGGLA